MPVSAAQSVLEGLVALLTPVAGGLAAALAIVVLTVAVRLLISPLSWLQARSARRGAALAPQVAELRKKHSDDPVRLASETLALQRANGASPFAALLPALAQAPFFMLMFHLVQKGLPGFLFGVPLTAHLAAGLPVFAALIVVALGLAWWTWRRTRGTVPPLLGALPFLTVLMVAWLPLAGGLYLVTSTAWTALEQALWRRPSPATNR
jgi:YidC/Oxa1 family membrane protein insertase